MLSSSCALTFDSAIVAWFAGSWSGSFGKGMAVEVIKAPGMAQ